MFDRIIVCNHSLSACSEKFLQAETIALKFISCLFVLMRYCTQYNLYESVDKVHLVLINAKSTFAFFYKKKRTNCGRWDIIFGILISLCIILSDF